MHTTPRCIVLVFLVFVTVKSSCVRLPYSIEVTKSSFLTIQYPINKHDFVISNKNNHYIYDKGKDDDTCKGPEIMPFDTQEEGAMIT